MKLKLFVVLSSIGILVACQTVSSELAPTSPVEPQTIQAETPASSPSLESTSVSTPAEIRADVPALAPTGEGTEMTLASLLVPSGTPPTIDGSHSPGEWDTAAVETFADGSQMLLTQAEDFLYLGIRANESGMIAGNVFINRGDEIAILHTSAALGTAIYQIGEDGWQQIQDFAWCCRNTGNSESAQAERAEFLQEEGWLAANGRMGAPNELEYQIRISEQNIRLAVVFTRSTYPYEKVPWPARLNDDCILPTPGGFPAELHFSPDQWARLELSR